MFSDKQKEQKKKELLSKCFELFVKKGLENTSLNELTSYCNVHKTTMYSYLESKDEIVIECAKMHMLDLEKMLAAILSNPPAKLQDTLKMGFESIAADKSKFRFVYQVISSPLYGDSVQKELSSIYMRYIDYSETLASIYNVDKTEFRPYFLLFISTMHDYCMWGNEALAEEKLRYIYNKVTLLEKDNVNKEG